MKWLLLDTACPRAMISVVSDNQIMSEVYLEETYKHGEKLTSGIETCLNQAGITLNQIEAIAVGKGPGSFVGVRIAIAHAKGICMALQIPLMGICTLSALAASSDAVGQEGFAFLDAKRDEFYVQKMRFDKEISYLGETRVFNQEKAKLFCLKANKGGFVTIGDQPKIFEMSGVQAKGMLQVLEQQVLKAGSKKIHDEVFSLTPAYVRSPDAKPPSFLS